MDSCHNFKSSIASVQETPAHLPCTFCRKIVPDRSPISGIDNSSLETPYERLDTYPKYPAFAASAQNGCRLCALIWQRLTFIPSDTLYDIEQSDGSLVWVSTERRTKRLASCWDRKVKIQATFNFLPYIAVPPSGSIHYEETSSPPGGNQRGGAVTSMWIRCRPVAGSLCIVDDNPWNGDTFELSVFDSIDLHSSRPQWRRQLPNPTTLSDDNVTMVKHWIDNCVNSHFPCSAPRGTAYWIPSRLLKLDDAEHGLKIRLIESSGHHLRVGIKFAALSHVWGNWSTLPPLRLLSSNFEQLKDGIKVSELPKNFVDAAHVCARLGLRYLWVDSLCIIQDSLGDWREQAVLMHLVYRHALVTIVATSATSCHDGFLERNLDTIPAVKVAYSCPKACENSASSENYMIVCAYANPQDTYRIFAINGSKWDTRAWTMQERSLSTRMVHFCQNKMFFECRGCLQSEENEPTQESDTINSTLWPRGTFVSFAELYQHWQLFVGEYCSRKLTVSTDRLPAIQSVAEEMAAVTGHQYIRFAGMWRSNLVHELLWYVSFGKAERPGIWRAPSWSWAAVEGQISLWQRDFRSSKQSCSETLLGCLALHSLEVLDTDQEHPDSRSINPGFLRVESLTKQFDRIEKHHGAGKGRSFFPYDLTIGVSRNGNGSESSGIVFAYGKLDFEDNDLTPKAPGMFLYLHVNNDARATGLILQAQNDDYSRGQSAWTRVGIATLFLDRSETPILNDIFRHEETAQEVILI
ncbi:HET-domain-containing protein [Xylariaceae sp. AK1471]|nr:HET-domain-containing protein [Xylariaceae sp. AK1471]